MPAVWNGLAGGREGGVNAATDQSHGYRLSLITGAHSSYGSGVLDFLYSVAGAGLSCNSSDMLFCSGSFRGWEGTLSPTEEAVGSVSRRGLKRSLRCIRATLTECLCMCVCVCVCVCVSTDNVCMHKLNLG